MDGEVVCVDSSGRPQFEDLLFRRCRPCFFAFDLLIRNGKDYRSDRLEDRKQELRRLVVAVPADSLCKTVANLGTAATACKACFTNATGNCAESSHSPHFPCA